MTLKIMRKFGKDDLAILYIAKYEGEIIEFVESLQPPIPREQKWVLIISTLYGCPIGCAMCDAGEYYNGKVPFDGMWAQLEHMISARYPDLNVPSKKLKIQFARMGEPALNRDVLTLLKELPKIIKGEGIIPCISTIAPQSSKEFFNELLKIKNQYYSKGHFQIQFSIHSTNAEHRKRMIPVSIWDFNQISDFGEKWFEPGDRKITLNFAVNDQVEINPSHLLLFFSPEKYLIKLTPLNPTNKATTNKIKSSITEENQYNFALVQEFKNCGYETILSIGEWEENQIGSNCGQYATYFKDGKVGLNPTYYCHEYELE